MIARKIGMYLSLLAGIACLLSAWQTYKVKSQTATSAKEVARLTDVRNAPPSAQFARRNQPIGSGAVSGSPAHLANTIYLSLDMRGEGEIPAEPLIKMAQCLRSENLQLVEHCQKLSFDLLSEWVISRPEADWHRSPVVDEFFRVFKASRYSALTEIFERRPLNYELKYLNQI